jgi:hypothetical protein
MTKNIITTEWSLLKHNQPNSDGGQHNPANWHDLFSTHNTDTFTNSSSINLSLLLRNHRLDNFIDTIDFNLDLARFYNQHIEYTRRVILDYSDLWTMHNPTLWHLQNNGISKEITYKLWHILRLETYESIANNRLQTFVLKMCANLLPTLQQKKRRYDKLYKSDNCLYCSMAPDSQKHWITCQNMKTLWQSVLHVRFFG